MINVVLLGGGNVGVNLAKTLSNTKGVRLLQWYNRSSTVFQNIKTTGQTTTQLNAIVEADIYLICVSDTALTEVSSGLEQKKGLVAHTAGSVALDVLKTHDNFGVFYPLQTFSKQKEVDFSTIPLCLEANTEQNLALLTKLANAIGGPLHYIDSTQRKALHIAAVFVNNFTNHLYTIGAELCEEHQLPFSILQPLIAETADKIKTLPPRSAQTGPAARNDNGIIADHLQQLSKLQHQKLYQLISTSIQQQNE